MAMMAMMGMMGMMGTSSIGKCFMCKTPNRVFADMSSYLGLLPFQGNYESLKTLLACNLLQLTFPPRY